MAPGASAASLSSRRNYRHRVRDTLSYESPQGAKKRMFPVRAIEAVITIAAACDQLRRLELRQLILHCLEGEKAQPRQFSDIQLCSWIREQELKNPGADCRE